MKEVAIYMHNFLCVILLGPRQVSGSCALPLVSYSPMIPATIAGMMTTRELSTEFHHTFSEVVKYVLKTLLKRCVPIPRSHLPWSFIQKTCIFTQEWGLAAPPHVQDGCSVMWQPAVFQWAQASSGFGKNWKVWQLQEKGPVQPSQDDESLNSQYLRVRLPNITNFSFFSGNFQLPQKPMHFARQMLMSLQDRDAPEQFIYLYI